MPSIVPMPSELGDVLQHRVHALWDRLSDFDATRTEEALLFLMAELKKLAGADDVALWLGAAK